MYSNTASLAWSRLVHVQNGDARSSNHLYRTLGLEQSLKAQELLFCH